MSTRRTFRNTLGTIKRVTRRFGDFLQPHRDTRRAARRRREADEERWRAEFRDGELWRFGNMGPYLKKKRRAAREAAAAAEVLEPHHAPPPRRRLQRHHGVPQVPPEEAAPGLARFDAAEDVADAEALRLNAAQIADGRRRLADLDAASRSRTAARAATLSARQSSHQHIANARRHAREEEEEEALEAWADEEVERERRLAATFSAGDEFLREHYGDEQPEGALGDLDAARGQRRRRGKTNKKSRTRKKRGRGKRKSRGRGKR